MDNFMFLAETKSNGSDLGLPIAGAIGVALVIMVFYMIIRFYRKVEQGQALIINKTGNKLDVTFTGGVVLPIFHKAEIMDISVKAMEVERAGKNGLICMDNIRADIRVTFYVRVNKTQEDVLKVAQGVGCRRACTKETMEELFQAKFSESLKTVGKQMEFDNLFTSREQFKEEIIKVIGNDLNGYKLEDVAIDYLEQTPLSSLDPDNIMDSQGMRKIINLTAEQAKCTNLIQREKEKVIKQQDVETRERVLELEKQQADAEARQQREIATIQARETAEAEKVEAEQTLISEQARIVTEETLAVANENKLRQIEIAAKAKERTIIVEEERVRRDGELESVERERLVAIKDIEKDKAVEIEKKKIQDVIRERVMVEKTVAVEQEKIKDTVAFATADRDKKVQITLAEKESEDALLREVKAAEAKERSAKSLYEQKVTFAEAQKVQAEKESDSKKLLAEGIIAEQSADGLAQVKVRREEAAVIELEGKADAFAKREAYGAEAFGTEATGDADASALSAKAKAQAEATSTQGLADATAISAKMKAEAEGEEAQGKAEAQASLAKYNAEAEGIDKKADAMKKFDGVGRDHEEFKLRLGMDERIKIAAIDVDRQVAEAQAKVLGEAMKSANIDIVGGDGEFLKSFFKSISLGKSVDGFVNSSKVANNFLLGDGEGKEGLLNKVKEMITSEGLKTDDIKNLTVSALLGRLALSKNSQTSATAEGLKGMTGGLGSMSVADVMAMWLAK